MTESNQPPVRIGLIGCGAIAEIYHLPVLAADPQIQLTLVDANLARADQMRDKFGPATCLSDYEQLDGCVDGVVIATPPASHHPIAKWFLQRGVHVLCEKPLTESIAEAEDLVRTAEQHGVQLGVNQTRRLFPTYQKIRQLIAQGELGTLQSIKYHDGVEFDWPAASPHHFKLGAKGTWSDTGVHLLDTVCYWLDAKPELVESYNDSYGGPEALATVRFRHDQCGVEIKVSRLGRLMNGFEIVGSQGTIEAAAETFDQVIVQHSDGRRTRHRCGSNRVNYNDFAKPLIDNFVDVIRGTAPPLISGASTLGTIDLLEQAYERAEPFSMPWNQHWVASTAGADEPSVGQATNEQVNRRVLVTGASGFLGGRVVESMLLSGSATPIAAIRHWTRASRVARHEVEIAICDILDAEQVDRAVANVDAIVHCAKTDDRESIVGGTRNLLQAAEKHGIRRMVYLSTGEVYGPDASGLITEQYPTNKTGRLYGDAKIEAEELCREFSGRVPSTILRPSIIYGPFSSSWSIDMAERLQSGKWGAFEEHGEGIANLIYVDDLVRAIGLALSTKDGRTAEFNVNGPDRLTWNEYFALFNQALQLPPLTHISASKSRMKSMVMGWADKAAGVILDRFEDKLMEIYLRGGWASRVMKRIKGEINSTPSGGELNDLFSRQAEYSDARAREELDYTPEVSIQQGLEMTVAWLRLHELAPKSLLADESVAMQQVGDPRTEEAAVL